MASSVQGKPESPLRLVSDEEALVIPEDARPTDDSPTVISKTPPLVEPISSNKDKVTELARRPANAESIVASLRGRHLAHYELIEPIGVGGMAAVIRARDTHLDRFVALKILPPEMAQQPDNISRFHQEAKAAAKLDHENIARVFFCGEDQGLHFIAFEFVEGINLRTMLERRGQVPVGEAVRYVLQVATGLEHANSRGVVHRDVKPSNIIITPDGRAKLVDMGLARNLERRGEADLTQSGMTLGTFDYISPEQALEPRDADARSDIYSLGCTFYHLITGQSPTPDGTPAKKLHHHQQLKPLDPRVLDPLIPDEIVLILDKMMQKHPKDRYQRPIHLVHHLVQVAQKLGVAGEMPEGVMVVDTTLPSVPRTNPLIVIGMALAALIAVTLILSLAPLGPTKDARQVVNASPNEPVDSKGTPKPEVAPVKTPVGQTLPVLAPKDVATLEHLHALLNDRETKDIRATLDATAPIELDGTVFKGRGDQRLTLESGDVTNNILLFKYKNGGPPVGLVLEGAEEVVFRRINFKMESTTTPNEGAAPICVRGVKKVTFENCIFSIFSQPDAPKISAPATGKRVPFASLLIDTADNVEYVRPEVIVKNCKFEGNNQNGGQVAIAINGAVNAKVTDTAFKPHSAFFSFRDKCTRERTSLTVERCTGFVVTGPALRFAKDASADVRLVGNFFSRPDKGRLSEPGLPQPGLFYFAGDRPIRFEGQGNLYHWLNHFIERPGDPGEFITKMDDYQKSLPRLKGTDDSIWIDVTDPTNPLQNPGMLSESTYLAFQLHAKEAAKYGMRTSWDGRPMQTAPEAIVAKAPAPKTKIVDADKAGLELGVYSNLAAAINEAKDGDTILIRHGKAREVVVKPSTLPKGVITIKADEGHKPILILDESSLQRDLAMFIVEAGVLNLQGLELRLDPAKTGYVAQSIVHLGETAQCAFKTCVCTLRRLNSVQLNVVTFTDLDMGTMMKTDPGAVTIPRAEFRDCFVRGKGDLISVRGCRPLQVEVEDSLIALAGQLLDTEASNKPMPIDKAMMSWKMTRSSFFTTESAFSLRSKTGKGLAKTDVKLEGCLLAGLTPEEPIASLMLNDAREDSVADFLSWEGNKQNFYANFDRMRDWKELFPELNTEYDKLAFPKLTDEVKQNLWDAVPGLFKATDTELGRLKGYGLQLTPDIEQRLLPTPGDEP